MDCENCTFKALKTCPGKEECEELIWMQNFWKDKNLQEIKELKEENERLKEENSKLETDLMVAQDLQGYAEIERDKYKKVLQEIKAIVCGNYEIIDAQGRKDILKLINKTEIK